MAAPGARRGSSSSAAGRVARGAAVHVCETRALLLARTPYAEADLVVQLFTLELGRVSALARGARRSQKRFGGTLEPMHELTVTLAERPGAELYALSEARLTVVRQALVQSLDRLDAAGRALGWVRQAAPARTPEPRLYLALGRLLDRLDAPGDVSAPRELAEAGLSLLVELGWGIELERCVACGKECALQRSAMFDPRRGGLVCRACGGARRLLGPALRGRMLAALAGAEGALTLEDAPHTLEIVEEFLKGHAGVG